MGSKEWLLLERHYVLFGRRIGPGRLSTVVSGKRLSVAAAYVRASSQDGTLINSDPFRGLAKLAAPGRSHVGPEPGLSMEPSHVLFCCRRGVLQWARANGCPWNEETCSSAARGGHLGVLQWARRHGCPWNAATCSFAAGGGPPVGQAKRLRLVRSGMPRGGAQELSCACCAVSSRGRL